MITCKAQTMLNQMVETMRKVCRMQFPNQHQQDSDMLNQIVETMRKVCRIQYPNDHQQGSDHAQPDGGIHAQSMFALNNST
jgi:hypothetical protein